MCNALMELMKDEFEEIEKRGISQGMTKGQTLQMITLIQRKLKKGKSLEAAAYELEEESDAIKDIYEMAKAHPAAGSEEIYHFCILSHECIDVLARLCKSSFSVFRIQNLYRCVAQTIVHVTIPF